MKEGSVRKGIFNVKRGKIREGRESFCNSNCQLLLLEADYLLRSGPSAMAKWPKTGPNPNSWKKPKNRKIKNNKAIS